MILARPARRAGAKFLEANMKIRESEFTCMPAARAAALAVLALCAGAAHPASENDGGAPAARAETRAGDLPGRVKALESWRVDMQGATAVLETRYEGLDRIQKDIRATVLAMKDENAGLASEWTAVKSRQQEVSIRVADVVAQVDVLAQAQQKTDAAVTRVEKQSSERPGAVQLMNQVDALNLELNKLRGRLEELTNGIDNAQKRQRDMYVDLDTRLRRVEQLGNSAKKDQETLAALEERVRKLEQSVTGSIPAPVASPAAAAAAAAPTAATAAAAPTATTAATSPPAASAALSLPPATLSVSDPAAVQRAYDSALSSFRTGDYPGAIKGFEGFLKANPKHSLAPNALYWIGEAHFQLKDYRAAIESEQKLLGTYPESSKAADAMLIVGTAEANLGDNAAAKKTFEDLINRHPNADAAEKARARLARLRQATSNQ
jgi:tol-pal system protein YbgF